MTTPPKIIGLHHVALNVVDLEASEHFYTQLLGFAVEWRPDKDNLYLTSGADNLALHRASSVDSNGALDHLGIILRTIEDVNQWYEFLVAHNVKIDKPVRKHRDGACSFYCRDPEDNCIQFIYHPPLSER